MTETTHEALVRQTAKAEELLEYFQGSRTDIEARMSAAEAAFPILHKHLWVDPVNGDDDASGAQDAPLATLEKAVESVPDNGSGQIRLLGDVTLAPARHSLNRKDVMVFGNMAASGRAKIKASVFEVDGYAHLSGWNAFGVNSGMMFRHCKLEFPEYTGAATPHERFQSILGNIYEYEKITTAFAATECDFIYPTANGFGFCATAFDVLLDFVLQTVTDVNGNMSGHYVEGVSPMAPENTRTLRTNMTSL